MKTWTSVAFGAVALAAASIGFAEPAAARGNVGIYVSPYGIGLNIDQGRNYCSDDWYRRNHWDYCSRFYSDYYDSGYAYPYFNDFYSNGYRLRHNNWDGRNHRHDRDDRRGDHRGEGHHDGGRHGR